MYHADFDHDSHGQNRGKWLKKKSELTGVAVEFPILPSNQRRRYIYRLFRDIWHPVPDLRDPKCHGRAHSLPLSIGIVTLTRQ